MKNNGKADVTIKYVGKMLERLQRNADLDKPEQVKQFIANLKVTGGYKNNLIYAYDLFCNTYKIEWEKPKYTRDSKLIRIPTTEQINMLIANSSRKMTVKLTLSKETGLRPVELCYLKVKDIDLTHKTVYPTTAKNGAPRALEISNSLTQMLRNYIFRYDLNPTDNLFKTKPKIYGKTFRRHRNKLAEKLQKPEIKTIRLYDFRHYFATRLYAKTKDILYVKQQMGHRRIETTLIYTQLLKINEEEEYTCKVAVDIEQTKELIEAGFEYITGEYINGGKLFRKRK